MQDLGEATFDVFGNPLGYFQATVVVLIADEEWFFQDEIDLEAKTWTIPASRMKAGAEHRVPLSDTAVALLQAIPRLAHVQP